MRNMYKRIFIFLLVAVLVLGMDQIVVGQQVGVNFNEQVDLVEISDVDRTETTWVRGFIEFFQFYDGERSLDTDPKVTQFLAMKDAGYKTILNLKWRFHNEPFPDPESPEMQEYIKFMGKILNRFWDKLDVIVVGNEPFIESRSIDRDVHLVNFYKKVTEAVVQYRSSRKFIPIYIGSFDNIYLQENRRKGFVDLMAYAKSNPEVQGVTIHAHHSAIEELRFSIEYTSDNIRDDQKIIITEYSLMKHWRSKSGETIPESFATKYDFDSNTKNYQVVDAALKNQFSKEQWEDFLSQSYWFENRKSYLWNSYQMFKEFPKVYVATYAFRQSYPFNQDFAVNTDPWVLNALYANRTVEPGANGENQFNYHFIDDFLRIQKDYRDNLVTGIEDYPSRPDLSKTVDIYPNPVKNTLNILGLTEAKAVDMDILDITGRVLWSGQGEHIDVSLLDAGIYLLRIPEIKKQVKFIKH